MDPGDTRYGDITIASDHEDCSYQRCWYRGGWRDNVEMFLYDFSSSERFADRGYDKAQSDEKDMSVLAAHIKIAAGETKKARFLISWNYPNRRNDWNANAPKTTWKNYYATLFGNSLHTAEYAFSNWDRLYGETKLFHDCLFSLDMEETFLDAVSANLSVLKSPTCLRLEDGTFYGFEGCRENEGSCEGSCTHVWNYAYALPYLFPALERSMRDADFAYNMREDGRMSFRLMLPLGSFKNNFRACVDGQMGGVIKTYRDWKISGDTTWLAKNWEAVKKSIAYAWAETNEDKWDTEKEGIIRGRAHHTLDMELFGPSSWLNGFYLAALKAGAEMAHARGEYELEKEYGKLFEKGKEYTDRELFNGEYYIQKIDLKDRSILESYQDTETGEDVLHTYWNEEKGQIKYQIGQGCMIDQVLPQWHANLIGLGEIFDKEQTKKALESLYRYNFKRMRDVINPWRIFSLNDEKGLLICTWPEGHEKPAIPLTYSTETMTGFEYQAAVHMLQEGMYEEGKSIIEAIRDRYDGVKRNPWNELECGSNYARSMASYSLLLTCSGFEYDGVRKRIGFLPLKRKATVSSYFFSCEPAWGTAEFDLEGWKILPRYGKLTVREIVKKGKPVRRILIEGEEIGFTETADSLLLEKEVELPAGTELEMLY